MDKYKYIVIPNAKPLYAMARCWGQTKGPLPKPTKVPIDVIADLLKQPKPLNLDVFEAKPIKFNNNNQPTEFAKAVKLTLKNYTLSYDEIVNGATAPVANAVPAPEKKPVTPVIKKEEPVKPTENPVAVTVVKSVSPSPAIEETKPELPAAIPAKNDGEAITKPEDIKPAHEDPQVEPEQQPATQPEDPFVGMTKKQRKEARRALEQQQKKSIED